MSSLATAAKERYSIYADADWAPCLDTCTSIVGFCVLLGDPLVSWKSKKKKKKKTTIFRSFLVEVEYHSFAAVASELTWLHSLLQDFHLSFGLATVIL